MNKSLVIISIFITPFPPDSYRDFPQGEGDHFSLGGNKKWGKNMKLKVFDN